MNSTPPDKTAGNPMLEDRAINHWSCNPADCSAVNAAGCVMIPDGTAPPPTKFEMYRDNSREAMILVRPASSGPCP